MSERQKLEAKIRHLTNHISALETERDRLKQRDWNYQAVFDRVTDRLASDQPQISQTSDRFEGITFVVVYYDIPRQIERTLRSLSPEYQGVDASEIEVIVVDNGSSEALPSGLQDRFPQVSKVLRVDGQPSPVAALNAGIVAARFDMVAMMIDGAHVLSPGVVRNARDVWHLFPNPVVNVPQYILGVESQNLTNNVNAFETEEAALSDLGWPQSGYSLFDYAVYPGENYHRTYIEAIETNCLITTKHVLDTYGAFDPRYDEAGGGFANLEIFSRLIHEPENSYVVLPGEGTFHQDHHGTTTQKAPEDRDRAVAGYKKKHLEVTGSEAILNARSPFLYGKVRRLTQRIPTISREFGRTSNRLQRQLADIFVGRVRAGMTDEYRPELAAGGVPDERRARVPLGDAGLLPSAAKRNGVKEQELSYLRCLKKVHDAVKPKLYFEIGIDTGDSLGLAKCPSVGVDPAYMLSNSLQAPTQIFKQTSDAFFADTDRCKDVFSKGIDLAFIDGMHLAEYVLRDFIETEKWMRPGGVILFDDVLPEQMEMLERERRFNAWCGDVFKIVPILRRYRPDLNVTVFETFIGPYRKGLAMISGADPTNRVLAQNYDTIEAEICESGTYDVGSITDLDALLSPDKIGNLESVVKRGSEPVRKAETAQEVEIDERVGNAVPEAPKLSVVVVAYNMARELPRTLRTLSAELQKGVSLEDYEIIVVDNGSTEPADVEACLQIAPNARFLKLPAGVSSPCHAANSGARVAKADRLGILIDGARMTSPGLLAAAFGALNQGSDVIVGTHGFHLGRKVQSEAVADGYSREIEDALLASVDWESDAYRLFDISVFSKSSGKGWDVVPSETNALFLHRNLWNALGGFDEQFTSDGGGLANLDLWKRACDKVGTKVRILLGEGTFHQIHGGVTTNSAASRREEFDREYQRLRGEAFKRPQVDAEFVGRIAKTETV